MTDQSLVYPSTTQGGRRKTADNMRGAVHATPFAHSKVAPASASAAVVCWLPVGSVRHKDHVENAWQGTSHPA